MSIISALIFSLFFACGDAQIVISKKTMPPLPPKQQEPAEKAEPAPKPEPEPQKPLTPVDEQDFIDFMNDMNTARDLEPQETGPVGDTMFVTGYDNLLKFYDPLRMPVQMFSFFGVRYEPVAVRDY